MVNHSFRGVQLYNPSANGTNLGLLKSVTCVPAPEIKEICILHNKIYTGYDFFDQ